MFDKWCEIEESGHGNRKTLVTLTEAKSGRADIQKTLIEQVRSHYDKLEQISDDVKRLGFSAAAELLKVRLPTTKKARSGDMGEILATEFMEYYSEFRIPVRRLRYKDGREMALRGDDFVGIYEDGKSQLNFLKGESKSRINVTKTTITEARKRLADDDGRPTPISLVFVTDRLLESNDADKELGRKVRDQIALKTTSARRVTHTLFILSGNDPSENLIEDLNNVNSEHTHLSAAFSITDHQDFIAAIYNEVGSLGDD